MNTGTKFQDILKLDPAKTPIVAVCFGTTRTNERCSVSVSVSTNNGGKENDSEKRDISSLLKKANKSFAQACKSSSSSTAAAAIIGDDVLEQVARFVLCSRHYKKQASVLVKCWKSEIEQLVEKKSSSNNNKRSSRSSKLQSSSEEMSHGVVTRSNSGWSSQHASLQQRATRRTESSGQEVAPSSSSSRNAAKSRFRNLDDLFGKKSNSTVVRESSFSRNAARNRSRNVHSLLGEGDSAVDQFMNTFTTSAARSHHVLAETRRAVPGLAQPKQTNEEEEEAAQTAGRPTAGWSSSDSVSNHHPSTRETAPTVRRFPRQKKQPRQEKDANKNVVARKPIEAEEECCICFETLLCEESQDNTTNRNDITWCQKQCGSNYHLACLSEWFDFSARMEAAQTTSPGWDGSEVEAIQKKKKEATCPSCRVIWSFP